MLFKEAARICVRQASTAAAVCVTLKSGAVTFAIA